MCRSRSSPWHPVHSYLGKGLSSKYAPMQTSHTGAYLTYIFIAMMRPSSGPYGLQTWLSFFLRKWMAWISFRICSCRCPAYGWAVEPCALIQHASEMAMLRLWEANPCRQERLQATQETSMSNVQSWDTAGLPINSGWGVYVFEQPPSSHIWGVASVESSCLAKSTYAFEVMMKPICWYKDQTNTDRFVKHVSWQAF